MGYVEKGVLIIIVIIIISINAYYLWQKHHTRYTYNRKINQHLHISTLALLNERMEILKEWQIQGKSSVLIGCISNYGPDEINLSDTAQAAFISKEHAVLNYSDGQWYVEDLYSENGTGIKRPEEEILWLTEPVPYPLERGDILYIAQTPILVK